MGSSRQGRTCADWRAIPCLDIIDRQNPTPYSCRDRKLEAVEGTIDALCQMVLNNVIFNREQFAGPSAN
jgi:hypothetical protein